MRKIGWIGGISLFFVKFLFFCFMVECINKFVCFFILKKNEKGLLFYDYYLTFDLFNFV